MPTRSANASEMVSASDPEHTSEREVVRTLLEKLQPKSYLRTPKSQAEVDRCLSSLVSELSVGMRIEIAQRVSLSTTSFHETARKLAFDDIYVARPVLENSQLLTDEDLLDVISLSSHAHMIALTKRNSISEIVSDALVDQGDDDVVVSLLGNKGAQIAYDTYGKITVRAHNNLQLQGPLIARDCVPLDLLNELYFKVEGELRQKILSRYESASTHQLSFALLNNRRRWLVQHGGLPKDYETVRAEIEKMDRNGDLQPPTLVRFLRERNATAFKLAFARLSQTSYELINRIVERKDIEALAVVARASKFDRALFVTLALLIANEDQRMLRAEEFDKLYETVSEERAFKVLCIWKTGISEDA